MRRSLSRGCSTQPSNSRELRKLPAPFERIPSSGPFHWPQRGESSGRDNRGGCGAEAAGGLEMQSARDRGPAPRASLAARRSSPGPVASKRAPEAHDVPCNACKHATSWSGVRRVSGHPSTAEIRGPRWGRRAAARGGRFRHEHLLASGGNRAPATSWRCSVIVLGPPAAPFPLPFPCPAYGIRKASARGSRNVHRRRRLVRTGKYSIERPPTSGTR